MSRRRFLLVCLQLIIVLVMSMIVEGILAVDASIESSRNPLQLYLQRENRNQRAYRLYHRCSEKQVVIKDSRIFTTGNITDMHGILVLESSKGKNDTVIIRIRGERSQTYACYNRRGRLIAKPLAKARGPRCEFSEEYTGGYVRYRSVYNEDWVLGFNQHGRPLNGSNRRREDCFKFIKDRTNSALHGRSSDHLTRHVDINEHNRRIGRRPHARVETSSVTDLFSTMHHTRHSKKSHRQRNRRVHHQRTSADR